MAPLNYLAQPAPTSTWGSSTSDVVGGISHTRSDVGAGWIDRESSLIEFYRRVLREAEDDRNPLLERVKFLAILGSNIREFIAVRNGRLRRPVESAALQLMSDAEECLYRQLAPALTMNGIAVPMSADLNITDLWTISSLDRPDLHYPPLRPCVPVSLAGRTSVFEAIREGDLLLHHPYESFEPIVDLVRQAASDPNVLSISMTLYRTDRHSPVASALLEAARRGKRVLVIVEPKARHDEQNNAEWACALARAGALVVRGICGLKVHAKLALIARREAGTLRRYAHVSTGNYHVATARTYTDLALLTCDSAVTADVADIFDFLAGHSTPCELRSLALAPFTMRRRIRQLIEREIGWTRVGEPGHMILKMNALVDREMMRLLQRAAQAGVTVDLIVRGICCLRPGISGLTDRIRVRSIVGRFLEHSRAWYFRNGGHEEAFITSADLRPRNLDRRVEVAVPLRNPAWVRRLRDEILATYLTDNVNAHELSNDGSYARISPRIGQARFSSQAALADFSVKETS